MKIAISGATGFIGTHLTAYLTGLGHRAVPLGRPAFRSQESLAAALAGCGAVVNLAGAPIDRRWSDAYKKQLYDSRIGTTRKLVAAINEMNPAPKVFVSASAVGYYPDQGCYDEYTAVKGTGFLSDLCESWEREASRVVPGIRLAVARFGVVLAPDEGVFAKMAFPFRKGIAVRIASGAQIFAWIDIGDLVRALTFILSSDMLAGAINLTAPERLTNAAFARAAARHYAARLHVAVPGWALRLLYGEASGMLVSGPCAIPRKLLDAGFVFNAPEIATFMSKLGKTAEK